MKRRIFILGLCLALVPGAISLANGKSESTQTGAKAVTLRYLTWDYSDRTASTDAWIAALKSTYNITVDMQNVPTDQYAAVFKTHFVAKDMPDLAKVHGIDKTLMVANENVQLTASSFVDLSSLPSVASYIPSVLDNVRVGGKLYYVPVSTNVLGVLYNKGVFKDAGVQIPTNIDEFSNVAEALKAKGIVPIASGAKDAWSTQIVPFIAFSQYVDGKDASIRTKLANGALTYADIASQATPALALQQDFAAKGYFQPNFLGTDINVASAMVGTGKAAMLVCGTWQVKTIQDANPNAQIGFFALPLNAKGEVTQVPSSANEGIVISSDSPNAAAAKQALDSYLSPENQKLVMADLNGISTNTKVQLENPFLQDVAVALKNGNVQPVWWGTNGLYFPSGTAFKIDVQIQSLLANETTVKQFIADFDAANAKALGK